MIWQSGSSRGQATAIWDPSGRKARSCHGPGPRQRRMELTGRQIVDEELTISWARAIRRLSGLNLAECPDTGPGHSARRVRRSMSQTVRRIVGIMRGRQVAAVGAEAEDEDFAIALAR